MIRYKRRFPKSVLFAKAAQLQSQIEFWLDETYKDLSDARVDIADGKMIGKLERRQDYLEGVREAATRARTLLFDCP